MTSPVELPVDWLDPCAKRKVGQQSRQTKRRCVFSVVRLKNMPNLLEGIPVAALRVISICTENSFALDSELEPALSEMFTKRA